MPSILRSIFAIVSLLFASPFPTVSAADKPVPVTPVPVAKDLLDGTRLVLKSADCSVDLPGPGWSWMTYDKAGQNFMCVNLKSLEIYMVGLGKLEHVGMVAHQPESLIASARKTQESRGGKLEGDKFELLDVPGTKKAAKITFTESDKTKKTFVCVWLFNTVDLTLVKIHCGTAGTSEPEAFKTLVKSLKMLDAKKQP